VKATISTKHDNINSVTESLAT